MGYLANFMVYTLAMVGVIVVALLIFKSATSGGITGGKSKYLKIIDTLNLAPRKTLYIVSTGREKFLIAGDVDKTSLISKLETSEDSASASISGATSREEFSKEELPIAKNINLAAAREYSKFGETAPNRFEKLEGFQTNSQKSMTFQETMSKLSKPSFMDKSNIGIKSSMLSSKNVANRSVLKNLAERIRWKEGNKVIGE